MSMNIQGRPGEPDLAQSQVSLHVRMHTCAHSPPQSSSGLWPRGGAGVACQTRGKVEVSDPRSSKTLRHVFVTWESEIPFANKR